MNQLEFTERISTLFGRFVGEVKALNAIDQYGINYLSETVLVPIFQEIFELEGLRNLNSESNNTPGIDLGDDQNRVAFQITATADNEKIKNTLRKVVEFKHFEKYDTVYVYILTEKHRSYSETEYSKILGGVLEFNKDTHILDFKDVLKKINRITEIEKIEKIKILLEKQFTDPKLKSFKEKYAANPVEELVTNLLAITLPSELYIADLDIDRKKVIKENRLSYKATNREVIFAYKRQNGLRFSGDWVDFNNQILTFHDLSNTNHDLSQIIDLGTVTRIYPEEFYTENQAQMRVFKALLKYSFSKQAYFQKISFYHDENIYVFSPEDEQVITRSESWNTGKRKITRDVIHVKNLKHDKAKAWYYTHLAFSISFKTYNEEWFLEITPEWFITKDGIQKHYSLHESVSSYLKKNERNQHVLNHTKFIANFLKYGKVQGSLFEVNDFKPKNFIQYGKLLTIKNAPRIVESEWLNNENEKALELMKDQHGLLELDI